MRGPKFLLPQRTYETVRIRSRGFLPHWDASEGTYFVTFRLADSLPRSVYDQIDRERNALTRLFTGGRRALTSVENDQIRRFTFARTDQSLDQGYGNCWMRQPEIADVVTRSLRFFDGQRYTLLASSLGYLERGVASWYGPDFHGVRTATGEPYDMYTLTAAHRTLPLPAYVRVTNLSNGRAVVVRVNDRGPFKANRIIDLSYAAALKLGMIRSGTTLVEVRALEPELRGAPPSPPPAEIYAQAGAFAVEQTATGLRDRIAAAGIANVRLQSDVSGARPLYRVRIGPIESVSAYDALVARLRAIGIEGLTLAPN